MNGQPLYSISDLVLTIQGRVVLDIDSLEIGEGGVTCLIGPNGAGKSVALSLLAGLEEPLKGEVLYRGRPIGKLAGGGLGSEVTLLHQHPFLFRGSVLSNVIYGFRNRGLSKSGKEARGRELLSRVGLDGYGERLSHRLSTGETARVALARALACGARTLLLDEPTAAIDRGGVSAIEEIIAAESAEAGKTVIMSTHSMDQAARLEGKVLFVREGRVCGREPENIFAGRVEERGGGRVFVSRRIALKVDPSAPLGECLAGIREDDIGLGRSVGEAEPSGVPDGRVTSLAADNGRIRATVDAGERFSVRLSPEVAGSEGFGVGSIVKVHIPPGQVRIIKQRSAKGE